MKISTEQNRRRHPSPFEPVTLIINILVSVLGAIIGLELITRLGISTNTSIIGALMAILIARIPIKIFSKFKDINKQNLIQTSISGATFSSANCLLLPIGIPYLLGKPDLVIPMLIGAILAIFTDATVLYFSFDSKAFPAKAAWPPGVAAAETILAAAQKGKKSLILIYGIAGGVIGKFFGIPTDVFGVAWIGNMFALLAFGIGLIVRGYSFDLFGVDVNAIYMPHGIMIGAGVVALIQIIRIVMSRSGQDGEQAGVTRSLKDMRKGLSRGYLAFLLIALLLSIITGIVTDMSLLMFIIWVLFSGFAAVSAELIVGIAAMHSGWFPAFATALIFLVLGMLIGFPPVALAVLVGFTVSAGPSFADMAYDLKAGWLLRGEGNDVEFERSGRKQQYFSELIGFVVAVVVVIFAYKFYFGQNLFPPVSRVYVATIKAGTNLSVAKNLMLWAIPGAFIQFIGGSNKQLGVLFATGLLINFPIAGITVIISLLIRYFVVKKYKLEGQKMLYILGAGFIAGSALYSFFSSTLKLGRK